MLGYLSANAQVKTCEKARVVNNLIDDFGFDTLNFWIKDTPYKNSIHSDANVMVFYLDYNKIKGVAGNELVAYLGKGQFSELQTAYASKDFFFVDSIGNYYQYQHDTINDYNDWKNNYGKVWIDKITKEEVFDLIAEHMQIDISNNKLLLLCN